MTSWSKSSDLSDCSLISCQVGSLLNLDWHPEDAGVHCNLVRKESPREVETELRDLRLLKVTVNHLVACVWYAIGNAATWQKGLCFVASMLCDLRTTPDRTGGSLNSKWHLGASLHYVTPKDGKNIWYRYSTALHWSITQFTPASMEVTPQNEYERFFTVCSSTEGDKHVWLCAGRGIILSGMLIFSSFVSAITNAMNQLRNLNSPLASKQLHGKNRLAP